LRHWNCRYDAYAGRWTQSGRYALCDDAWIMKTMPVDEVKQRLDSGEPLIFVDARSEQAWQESHVQIPNSIRVPPDQAEGFAGALANEATIITYCT
jgi:rhodanese-related sulfurtransferase